MFQDVSIMNEAFGNPQGNPEDINFERLQKQCDNIGDEFEELQEALASKDPRKIRDGLCDILVFALGAFHFMGADADADMGMVFRSNMSKFCSNEEELEQTRQKYRDLGVTFYEEGEFPAKYLKCAEDFTDVHKNQYRKGKFLKGINFKEPVFQ